MFGSRLWTPLAMSNPEYEQMLRQRALDRERRNYVEENKDHVEKASVNNRNNNPKPRRVSLNRSFLMKTVLLHWCGNW